MALPPDRVGALRMGPTLLAAGAAEGTLAGWTFVAKDLIDVAGLRTGAGNPTWLTQAAPAPSHADAVARLLDAGADLVGKSHTDELGYSLSGSNLHYGTPRNVLAPGRLAGGSSSGSAAAVASGVADIGLGTDTGGSIRVPASYCGLFGLRPTHGRVPTAGVVPLAPSFDTVGALTADGGTLRRAMQAMLDPVGDPTSLDPPQPPPPVRRLVLAVDAVGLLDPPAVKAWQDAVAALAVTTGLPLERIRLTGDLAVDELPTWNEAFATLLDAEAWATHGGWIEASEPNLAPDVAARFAAAAAVTEDQVAAADEVRTKVRARLDEVLEAGTAIVLPSASGPAPPRRVDGAEFADMRSRTTRLTCVASLAGVPALALPLARVGGLPLGVGVLAARDTDESLLDLAAAVRAR